jgi:hypothetical protein
MPNGDGAPTGVSILAGLDRLLKADDQAANRQQTSPLWKLMCGDVPQPKPRKEYEKGYLDAFESRRFEYSDLNEVSYAFGYLTGYAVRNNCRVNWKSVLKDLNPLQLAIDGDPSLLVEYLLSGISLSESQKEFFARAVMGKWKRPPHAPKRLVILIRDVVIGHHVLSIELAEGNKRHGSRYKPAHPPKGVTKFAVAATMTAFDLSEKTVRNARKRFCENDEFERWLYRSWQESPSLIAVPNYFAPNKA